MSVVVVERSDLTILDTREMGWVPYPELAAKIKVLDRYETGEPCVGLIWMPPGEISEDLVSHLPHRHYHAWVHEFGYILGGDLRHWEYESAEQQHGDIVLFRPGYYMHRLPGSIHGLEESMVSETGFLQLFWREGGTGNFLAEPNAAEGTPSVPFEPGRKQRPAPEPVSPGPGGVIYDRPDLALLDTREMAWQDFPGLAGCRIKVLSRLPGGEPRVMLIWFPPIELLPDLPHRHYHRSVTEYGYVLSGELPHWEYESAAQKKGDMVLFREGFFMKRLPGSIHGLEKGPVSKTGCLLLAWRDGTGNFAAEPNFHEETTGVPY